MPTRFKKPAKAGQRQRSAPKKPAKAGQRQRSAPKSQPNFRERLLQIEKELNLIFPVRARVIRGMLLSLLAGKHVFLLGPPGTAKSMLAEKFAEIFSDDISFFSYLMTKFTDPSELFGPYDYRKFLEGEIVRNMDGYFPSASVAILDEIFKSSSAILNSLLMALDERKRLQFGNLRIDLPLEICIGASNELPSGNELSALYDRFVVKMHVDYITEKDAFMGLLEGIAFKSTPRTVTTKITLAELQDARRTIQEMDISPDTFFALHEIRHALHENHKIVVSDRRWVQTLDLIRANAWLSGDTTAYPEACSVLRDVLWSSLDQRKKVDDVVNTLCEPVLKAVITSVESIMDCYEKANGSTSETEALENNRLILAQKRHLEKEVLRSASSDKDKNRVNGAILLATRIHEQIARKCFNVEMDTPRLSIPPWKAVDMIKNGESIMEYQTEEDDEE